MRTQLAIVGGGPAGMMLGLARGRGTDRRATYCR